MQLRLPNSSSKRGPSTFSLRLQSLTTYVWLAGNGRMVVILLMDKILHDPKDPKLWELWYIPYYGSCRILSISRSTPCISCRTQTCEVCRLGYLVDGFHLRCLRPLGFTREPPSARKRAVMVFDRGHLGYHRR